METLYWYTVQVVGTLKTITVYVKARGTEPAATIKKIARVKAPGGVAYNILSAEEINHA